MRGDYEWANEALSESLGEIWESDNWAHVLLYNGYYDMELSYDLRMNARDILDSYMDQYYDIDFGDEFDFDAWREWYDAQ